MKSAFRHAVTAVSLSSLPRSLNPNPNPNFSLILLPLQSSFPITSPINVVVRRPSATHSLSLCHTMAEAETRATLSATMEKQFDNLRHHLEESGSLRDRILAVASEIESANRRMQFDLLLVHQSRPLPEVLEKAKAQIDVVKDLYSRLAEIIRECPGQYYRYHGDWKSETQAVVSMLAFMHWLETGTLLVHTEAEEKLGLNTSEFGLDIEDYLIGICFMSNELPRYVVNRVTAADYDCPRKVMKFLTDLHAAFRMLNLRNDFLRKKFDGMKYDLRKVEEVYYDVKIRGLAVNGDSTAEEGTEGQ